MIFSRHVWVRLGIILIGLACIAAEKLPSAYDGAKDSFLDTGYQNMPFKLYGVAIKWDQACRQGDAAQCVRLAEAFETGLGDLRPEIRVSLGYYRLACDGGNGHACARASTIMLSGEANSMLSGEAKTVNVGLAQKTAETGCTALKNQEACAALANALMSGAEGPKSARAAGLLDAACAAGEDSGCRLKAKSLFYDTTDAASRARAIPLFEAACTAKRAWGCSGLADAYENGWGVPRDRVKAMDSARIGCEHSTGNRLYACRQHGTYLTYGTDKAAINKGEQYLNTACIAGDAAACTWLGKLGLRDKQGATTTMGEGLYYERRACDLEYGEGCQELALAYQIGNGINPDPAVAIALYDRGCSFGTSEACDEAAKMLAEDRNVRSSIPAINPALPVAQQLLLAQEAVKGSNPNGGVQTVVRLMYEENEYAEWLLGGWLYYGLDGVFDTSRKDDGFILIENAARVGHIDADIWVGMAYWYGDGVEEDREKGEHYMLIAAQQGSEEAEAIYTAMKNEPARVEMAERQRRMEEAMIDRRSNWEKAWDAWDAAVRNYASSGGGYSSPNTYSGNSVSSVVDELNWNNRFNYLSGATTACPSSNPYCR